MDSLPREAINVFTSLTERVASSKTNVLDFGSEKMTFYWGEVHVIKMIGDYPGMFSSEIACRFSIARAVVHKTLLELKERGLVMKIQDDADKKRALLFLTERGRQAYLFHEEYHNRHDKALFEHVDGLSQSELEAVKKFLEHANNLIESRAQKTKQEEAE